MTRACQLAFLSLFFAASAAATPPIMPPTPQAPPKLMILIAIDQLGAQTFDEYRGQWTGGLARVASGTVYRNGYQSHATTETCPGHATIATGVRPGRSGIVANEWFDPAAPRADKVVYCAEDEAAPGSTHDKYVVSAKHLRVPSIGDMLKRQRPGSRVVAIAEKDRSAVMMGGHQPDLVYYLDKDRFVAATGRPTASLAPLNRAVAAQIAAPQEPLVPPAYCAAKARAVPVDGHPPVGAGAFARNGGDDRGWRTSPAADGAVLALAAATVRDLALGTANGTGSDLLAIGLSANDYVGHYYGSEGQEMCLHLASVDRDLGDFFAKLDSWGIDYAVALSADHGVADLPERARLDGDAKAARIDPDLTPSKMSAKARAAAGISGPILADVGSVGDLYLDPALALADRDRALAAVVAAYRAHPQVEAVFTKAAIAPTPVPTGDPAAWPLIGRVRANFDPERSGDLYVVLKDHVTPIGHVTWSVATHGSPWDHDRRVPIAFWRKGATPRTIQANVEVVDIVPTLASALGLSLTAGAVDGRCLDAISGVVCPTQ